MENKKTNLTQTAQTPDSTQAVTTFTNLLRAYETAHAQGTDTTAPLYALATAVTFSVLKKCIDPRRGHTDTADTDTKKSRNGTGMSPALLAIRRGILADLHTLDSIADVSLKAYGLSFDKDGNLIQTVLDKQAATALDSLQGLTLSDGIDLVHTAVVAILEQTADHADPTGTAWLEHPYTLKRLKRKVLIKTGAEWETTETTPIQEIYRAVRREIQNSRAIQADPRNGYLYIEDVATDPDSTATETIYRRLHKWADIGGYTQSGHFNAHGHSGKSDTYTADIQTVADYDSIITALNLTHRQATIVRLRMSGYGADAIGTCMGISSGNVYNILKRIRKKCEQIGFTPDMWEEMNTSK